VISEALNYDTVLRLFASFFLKSFYLPYFESRLHRHQRSLRLWHGFRLFHRSFKIVRKDARCAGWGSEYSALLTSECKPT
jgi:hypothetical protein